MAVLIFSFGLLGLAGLQSRAIQFSGNSEDRNIAASLAAELAGHVYTMRSGSAVPSAVKTAWETKVTASLPGGTGAISALIPATSTTPALHTITITWQPVNSSTVSTYVTDVVAQVSGSVQTEVP